VAYLAVVMPPQRLHARPLRSRFVGALVLALLASGFAGCGTTQQSLATQQLLESDAIDAAIAQVDFTPLANHKVYFDPTYLQDYKGVGFVNSNYVISGLRQQILSSGCLLQETRDTADYIVEGRIGTLGSDQHDVVYGLPKNNALNAVASAVPGTPSLPSVPELALAKRVDSQGAAKLALFAYDRESREPVWQSGLSLAKSSSRNTWLLGAGPFQYGTIHRDDVAFAGSRFRLRPWKRRREVSRTEAFVAYERSATFQPIGDSRDPEGPAHAELEEPARFAQAPQATPIEPSAGSEPEIQQVSAEVVVDDPPPAPSTDEQSVQSGESANGGAPAGSPTPAAPPPFPE
jgi:hypothetical protein